jgi:hypothetical protein
MIVFKRITPRKFNDQAFQAELMPVMAKIKKGILKDFESTVDTWTHKPKFETLEENSPNNLAVMVGTDDEIYGYVNNGTEPHTIVPVTAKALRFPWEGYGSHIPKTVPNWIGSFNERVPGTMVFRKSVHHPGTEARNFDKLIGEIWQAEFAREVKNAMERARRKSGHAI